MKANPGDIVVVIVDGVPYETYIDDSGVQRFRANGVIRALLNDFHAYYDALNAQYGWGPSRPALNPGTLCLNEIAVRYHKGKNEATPPWSRRDYIEFNMMLGYSVCGLCELSLMDGVKVENPLWDDADDKNDETRPT